MMNLADYANYLYSAYHSNPSGSYARTPEEKEKLDNLSREDFVADMVRTNQERWQSGGDLAEKSLFAGSASRAKLSDTEIAVLANKYDLHNLDQKSYDNFLDDLADMGAISEREKGVLGYGGLITAGYFDANGNMVMNGIHTSTGSTADLMNSKTGLTKWLAERVKWEAQATTYENPQQTASSQLAAKRENEMFASLNSIVNRILTARGSSGVSQHSSGKNGNDLLVNRTNAYLNSSRPKLTDSEIRELGQKYDFRNMTQETYDAFLDEMVDKGVLTRAETEYFGYGGEVRLDLADSKVMVMTLANVAEKYTQNTPFLENGASGSGNMVEWLAQMIPSVDGSDGSQEGDARANQRMEMYGALIDVVFRATGTPYEPGRNVPGSYGGSAEDSDIVSQVLNPNSDFYRDMYNRMRVQLEQSDEEKKKQAIIDALDAILESLSAKKDDPDRRSTVSSMAELSEVTDSLDRFDPRKEQLNLLRERLQQLGIYADLDVGIKDKDDAQETLTQSLIREENQESNPSLFDII